MEGGASYNCARTISIHQYFFKANWDIWSLYVSDNVVDLREHTYKNELFLILKVHLVYWEGCIYKLITIR